MCDAYFISGKRIFYSFIGPQWTYGRTYGVGIATTTDALSRVSHFHRRIGQIERATRILFRKKRIFYLFIGPHRPYGRSCRIVIAIEIRVSTRRVLCSVVGTYRTYSERMCG